MFKKFRKNLLQLVLIIFSLYFFVLVFLYFYQRNLLYHPNENNYSGDKILVKIENFQSRNQVKKLIRKTLDRFESIAIFRSCRVNLDVDPY